MKFISPFIAATTLAASLVSVANAAEVRIEKEKLFGSWNCEESADVDGGKMHVSIETTYVRNGRTHAYGSLTVDIPAEGVKLEYIYSESGTWELDKNFLVSSTTEIKLVNISHPGLDDVFNLGNTFPQNISESAEVLGVTDKVLVLKSESSGEIQTCTKTKR